MIPHPEYNIWEHTRQSLFDLYAERARNERDEMTCHKQAAELLAPHATPNMTVLDAGCGSGYFYWSFADRGLPVEYHGIDYTESFIDIGRRNLPRPAADRLRHLAIEDLTDRYDAVFCINTLFCLPDYRQGLERLCQAARRFLILRTTLDHETRIRYETDQYLDPGYRNLKSYFNIWNIDEVMDFIREYGFDPLPVTDQRTGDRPEISAGKVFPYKVLFCRRVQGA
jgi:2-polyprenyl-3-methyl-5-hydroxy-6-metoxy-1,4-benzoquinol methylase